MKYFKFFYKKPTYFILKSLSNKNIGFYYIKKKIYIFKFKKLIQNLKIGNLITKKFFYRLFYFLRKIYNYINF